MSTERPHWGRQAEPPAPENQDPLTIALGEAICKCCDELGVMGCGICPVQKKCCLLWQQGVEDVDRINVTDYRRLDQKFALLKQERDAILTRRGERTQPVGAAAKTPPVSTL